MFGQTIKRVVYCAALAAAGLGLSEGMGRLMEQPGAVVDFSRRARVVQAPAPAPDGERLRFAVATMVSAEATFATYHRLVRRVCRDVGREDAFIVRSTYAAVRQALERGEVDVAFVCTGTYVHSLASGRVRLLAQPEFVEGLEYRCVIVVPSDSPADELEDLRGAVMAFTDPESNTGCLVPSAACVNRGYDPRSFFGKVVFTGNHDRSILAVARGVVDAAAVDALVLASKAREDASLKGRLRVVWRSEPFGPPPMVVPAGLPAELQGRLRSALLGLHRDPEGREILAEIGIRRFVPPRPDDYRGAIRLHQLLERKGGRP